MPDEHSDPTPSAERVSAAWFLHCQDSEDRFTFHSLCFRCVLCSKQIVDGTYFILESDLICFTCLPACYLCGGASEIQRSPQRFGEYLFANCDICEARLGAEKSTRCHSCGRTGRFLESTSAKICPICKRFALLVNKQDQLLTIFSRVCQLLKDHIRISIPPIPIEFMYSACPLTTDHNEELRTLGLAQQFTTGAQKDAKILILHNLPTITTASVIVHELFHCWLFFNHGTHQIRCKIIEEGVCRLAQFLFLCQCQAHPELFELSKWQKSILFEELKHHERITSSRTCHSQDFHTGLFEVSKIFDDSPFNQNFESFLRHESRLSMIIGPPTKKTLAPTL